MKTSTTTTGKTPAISETQSLKQIRKLHGEIFEAARTSLPKAIKIGELLTGLKDKMEHGQWLPWIEKHLPFSERTAQNYLRCFEEKDRLKSATVADLPLSVSGALALLSEPKAAPAPLLPTGSTGWADKPISAEEYFSLPVEAPARPFSDFDYIAFVKIESRLRAGVPTTPREILEIRGRADARTEMELAA